MPRQETLADRLTYVAQLQVTPNRLVGYLGQTVAFTALPLNANGETIQGVRFDWESSDTDKALIDDAGQARLLQPGLVRITCRAGSIQTTVPLLVRPGNHPRQSDAEWQGDQHSFSGTTGVNSGNSVGQVAASLLNHLMPTAEAQAGWTADVAYDEMWSDPRNLVGKPRDRAAESTRTGTVLPESSNFSFGVPIINLGGRGINASLTLFYNSQLWSRRNNTLSYNAIVGWPGPGFSLGFGRIVTYDIGAGGSPNCKYMLIDPDGTRHYLGGGLWADSGYASGGPFETNDGSHIIYTGNGREGGDLHYPDGTIVSITMVNNRLLPTTIHDPNGNYIQVAYKPECVQVGTEEYCGVFAPMAIDYITDTMGRIIQFNYDSNYRLASITAPGFGGTAQNPVTQTLVQFDNTLRHIYFPATGNGYLLSYSSYGAVTSISGRRQMSIGFQNLIQDGVESNNVSFNYPASAPTTDQPAFTQRTETATNAPTATYTYSSSTDSIAQTKTFTITQPNNSTLNLTRSTNTSSVSNGLLVQNELKNSSAASMSKSLLTYVNDGSGEPQVQTATNYDDAGTQSKTDFDYNQYGDLTNKREYGYQASGAWQVRRRTRNVYQNGGDHRITEKDIYDAQLNTNDADDVLLSKTTYTYDDYAAMGGIEDYRDPVTGQLPPNPPGHLSIYTASYTTRGNVTGVTQWYDLANNLSYTRLRKIDVFGNVVKEQLACCNQETQMASPNYFWSVPEQVTKGVSGGPQLTYSANYDFNTSATNWEKDENNLQTSYQYDASLRQASAGEPSGASSTASYSDGTLSASSSTIYDDNGTSKTVTTTTNYDGWGQVIQTVNENGGQVNITYDAKGRVQARTNPFQAGGTPGPSTTYQYDALGRITVTTLPGGNTIQNIYSGNTTTVVDEVGRRTQRQNDGLGRLTSVTGQDSTGALTLTTNYSYDILDDLTQINQGGQTRGFKYDALRRKTFERLPELSATINDGTGTLWSRGYTYTSSNKPATRTDPRGVVTTYSYDTLNRVSQISYNTVAGVSTSPTVTYTYDTDSTYGTTNQGAVVRINVGTGYQERYTFDQYKRAASTIFTIGARSYTTSYQYNQAGQPLQVGHMNYQYDSAGRLLAVGAMSNITYNFAGQVTGDRLTTSGMNNGYVVTSVTNETFGYGSNRMQLTSQTAVTTNTNSGFCIPSCPSPPPGGTNLSLTYSHQATAGQMGANTTAGNAGQLMSVSGTVGGLTESANYTYDNPGRLVTSNQTSNGTSAQRRFQHDRWGNRTAVYDAVSGGNQIQAIALQQSSSVPTNQISSVITTGTVSYAYDAAGNVTSDGVRTYTYDSENRLVNVSAGAALYGYDHQNRRYKKTIGSTVTHYIWQGDKVLAEYNGSTGTLQVSYWYARDRLFKKDGTTTQVFLNDRLSLRLALSDIGVVAGRQGHLPFGEDFAESGTQEKHHLTNYERDAESGTDYAVNRQYAQPIGRFLQTDPASCIKDNPQTLNRYSYVHNDSINLTDPDGRIAQEVDRGRGPQAKLSDEDDDADEDQLSASSLTSQGKKRRKKPPKPPKPKARTRVVVSVSSSWPGALAVQAYGIRDTPREVVS